MVVGVFVCWEFCGFGVYGVYGVYGDDGGVVGGECGGGGDRYGEGVVVVCRGVY